MKRLFPLGLFAALLCAGLACPRYAKAVAVLKLDMMVSNPLVLPSAGSVDWLSDWGASAYAMAQDNATPFSSAFDTDPDADGEAAAGVASFYVLSAASQSSANTLSGASSLDAAVPDNVGDAWGNSQSTLQRAFRVTGGQGPVNVDFSFDFVAQWFADADWNHTLTGTLSAYLYVTELGPGTQLPVGFDMVEALRNGHSEQDWAGTHVDDLILNYDAQYLLEVRTGVDGLLTPIPYSPVPDRGATLLLLLLGILVTGMLQAHAKGSPSAA